MCGAFTGHHRVVSIKCGHLFGQRYVTRQLDSANAKHLVAIVVYANGLIETSKPRGDRAQRASNDIDRGRVDTDTNKRQGCVPKARHPTDLGTTSDRRRHK
jgi:hypothetical protein